MRRILGKRFNRAVSPVIGTILVVTIVITAVSFIFAWAVPYIEQVKSDITGEAVANQFSVIKDFTDEMAQEGTGTYRIANVAFDKGTLSMDTKGGRIIGSYTYAATDELSFSGLLEDSDSSFTITSNQPIGDIKVFHLASDPEIEINPCETVYFRNFLGETICFLKFDLTDLYELEEEKNLDVLFSNLKFSFNDENYAYSISDNFFIGRVSEQGWNSDLSKDELFDMPFSKFLEGSKVFDYNKFLLSSDFTDYFFSDYPDNPYFSVVCGFHTNTFDDIVLHRDLSSDFTDKKISSFDRFDSIGLSNPCLSIKYLYKGEKIVSPENQYANNLDNSKVKSFDFSEALSIKHIEDDTYGFKLLNEDVVEIGEEHHSPAQPYIRLSKWDDEVNFKIHIPYVKDGDKSFLDDKLVYSGDMHDVWVYPVGPMEYYEEFDEEYQKVDINEDGGVEFDVMIYNEPSSNVFSFPFESENLDFYYQPALHPDHPTWADDDGDGVADNFRPENVVGSYAVYHSEKSGDFTNIGGKNYRTGKAFHIYRPKIFSADGTWTWGELYIDSEQNILTVTIDQGFLENAEYPLRLDPTFGFSDHSSPSGWFSFGDKIIGLKATTGSNSGYIQKVTAYLKVEGGGGSSDPLCIAEDVLIETDNGPKKIQDIKIGDKVLSYNFKTEQIEHSTVTYMWGADDKSCLKINDLIATDDHKIFTKDGLKNAGEIDDDDVLLKLEDGLIVEEKISVLGQEGLFSVYDLVVEPNNNFFANDVLVHNAISEAKAMSAVYKYSDCSLVGSCPNEVSVSSFSGDGAEKDFSYTSGAVQTNTYYWLTLYGIYGNDGSGSVSPQISYDTASSAGGYRSCSGCGFPTNPLGSMTTDNRKYNIWCTIGASVNYPPELSYDPTWTYGVNPNSGDSSTDFNFKVYYNDPEDADPTVYELWVLSGSAWDSYSMSGSGDESYYTKTLSGFNTGFHSYYFHFSDGENEKNLEDGLLGFKSFQVTAPVLSANAGDSYSGELGVGDTITLDASGSTGAITSYDWEIDGDNLYDDASGVSPTINVDDYWSSTVTDYEIGLRVNDGSSTDTDTASVTISLPVLAADAGGPYSGELGVGDTITLDGSDSTGAITSYDWEIDGDNLYDDASGVSPTINVDDYWSSTGTNYEIGLRVTDSGSSTNADTASVTISYPPLSVSIDGPTSADTNIYCKFTATAEYGATPYTTYEWDFDYDGMTFDVDDTGTTNELDVYWATVGTHTLAVRVTDSDSPASTAIGTIDVQISAPAYRVCLGQYSRQYVSEPVDLTATITPGDSTAPYSYTWDFGDDTTYTSPTPTYDTIIEYSKTYSSAGTKTVAIDVEDSTGDPVSDSQGIVVEFDEDTSPYSSEWSQSWKNGGVLTVTNPGSDGSSDSYDVEIDTDPGDVPDLDPMQGAIIIYVYDTSDELIGKIFLFDFGRISNDIEGSEKTILENSAVIHEYSNSAIVSSQDEPRVTDDDNGIFSMRITMIRGEEFSVSRGSVKLKINHCQSAIRVTREEVYNLMLYTYDADSYTDDAWYRFFQSYSFKEKNPGQLQYDTDMSTEDIDNGNPITLTLATSTMDVSTG